MTGLLLCLRASREEARAPHTLRIPAPSAPHRRAELPGAAVGGAEREGRRAGAGSGWREAGIDPLPRSMISGVSPGWGRGEGQGCVCEGGKNRPSHRGETAEVVAVVRVFLMSRLSQGWNLQEEDEGERSRPRSPRPLPTPPSPVAQPPLPPPLGISFPLLSNA